MTYGETVEFLFSQLPMFQRTGAAAYKPNLDRIEGILKAIGNPEKDLKYVHVAGTNGKGSVCNLCAAMLQTAGYKTGLFTSPHFVDYRERIRVNGTMVPEQFIVDFVSKHEPLIAEWQPSFFEWTTAIAFQYFRDSRCDIVVLETGMGGRLDSTNVVKPLLTVITSIGLDHQQFLGDTIEEIAMEKAGIMKHGCPVIIGDQQPHIQTILKEHAKIIGAETRVINQNSSHWEEVNASILSEVREILNTCGFDIALSDLDHAKEHTTELTGYWGRYQRLQEQPTVIVDTAHNDQALDSLIQRINETEQFHKLIVVFGTTHGTELATHVKLFPSSTHFIFTTTDLPRMLQKEELLATVVQIENLQFDFADDPQSALELAKDCAGADDLILICGSVFLAAAYHPQNHPAELG